MNNIFTNEELAVMIQKTGDPGKRYTLMLWKQVEKFAEKTVQNFFNSNEFDNSHYYSLHDDMMQEAYVLLSSSVKTYRPEKKSFI